MERPTEHRPRRRWRWLGRHVCAWDGMDWPCIGARAIADANGIDPELAEAMGDGSAWERLDALVQRDIWRGLR